MSLGKQFLIFFGFLTLSLLSQAKGSCWRYGHSCWGGHGKRSEMAQPRSAPTTERHHLLLPIPLSLLDEPNRGEGDYYEDESENDGGGEDLVGLNPMDSSPSTDGIQTISRLENDEVDDMSNNNNDEDETSNRRLSKSHLEERRRRLPQPNERTLVIVGLQST